MHRSTHLLLGVLAVTCSACLQGPDAFRASHAQHNEALRARIDEELLLNLVRLRYRDSPLFLQVGSVVTQFEVRGSLGASATLPEGGDDSLGLNAGVGWSEEPTYTFTPLQDDEFVRRLLTPIDFELVVLLQRSGWSIERVLRLTLEEIGGLANAPSASGPTPARAPVFAEFLRATRVLRELQQQGGVQIAYEKKRVAASAPIASSSVDGADLLAAMDADLRFEPVEGAADMRVLTRSDVQLILQVSAEPLGDPNLEELSGLLGLAPGQGRYALDEGVRSAAAGDRGDAERIGVSTRSLLGTFFYLSHGIEVPPAHVEDGLVTVTRSADGTAFDWGEMTSDLLRVRTSPSRPAGAAIAVPYRGHWFYVEDSDLDSKSTLALLLEMFNMSAEASFSGAPTLTLAVGG